MSAQRQRAVLLGGPPPPNSGADFKVLPSRNRLRKSKLKAIYLSGMKKYADDKYSLTSANWLDRRKSAPRASSRIKKLNGSTDPSSRSVG